MFKGILLASLAVAILAGGAMRASRIVLEGGRRNNLDFTCGIVDSSGSTTVAKEDYSYSFSGLPAWLTASGASVSGIPPRGSAGSYDVTVYYTSPSGKSGSSNVLLTIGGGQEIQTVKNGDTTTITYISGANYRAQRVVPSAYGNYVVLVPVKPSKVSTVTVSPAPVPAPVICTAEENNVALANAGVASTQTELDKAGNDAKAVQADLDDLANKRNALNNQIANAQAQLSNTDGQIGNALNNINNLAGALNGAQAANTAANNAANNANNAQNAAQNAANDAAAKKSAADAALANAQNAAAAAAAALQQAQDAAAQANSALAAAQGTAQQAAQALSNDQNTLASASGKVAQLRAALDAALADEAAANQKVQASTAANNAANNAAAAAQNAADQASNAADQASANNDAAQNSQAAAQAANDAAAGAVQAANGALAAAQDRAAAAAAAANAAQAALGAAQQALNDAKVNLGNLQNQKANQGNALAGLNDALAGNAALTKAGLDRLAALNALKDRLKGQLAQALSNAALSNIALQACKAKQADRNAIAANPGVLVNVSNDNSCGGRTESLSVVRGAGKITNIGPNSITIDNKTVIAVGGCTNIIHSSGARRPLKLADKVTFDAINAGGRTWARAISCSG